MAAEDTMGSVPANTDDNAGPVSNAPIRRRTFLKVAGVGAAAMLSPGRPVMAGPFDRSDFEKLIPADKQLHPDWVRSLFARGDRAVYSGADLRHIGMPVGGLCAGQLYLGGDGRLWHWDIFNQKIGTGDSHYANPLPPESPVEQGFALRVTHAGATETRTLDRAGFPDVSFCGEYPIGFVEYRDKALPVAISLEAFSPFIPLNADDSGLPATVLQFTLKNTGSEKVEAELSGWLQNAVCLYSGAAGQWMRRNRIVRDRQFAFLECSAAPLPESRSSRPRPDIPFEDFEKPTYEGWTVTGTAFGAGPIERDKIPAYQGDVGGTGKRVVNSHASAPGADVGGKDAPTGTLTSRPFRIERRAIHLLVGGGSHAGRTCVNLLVDEKVVRSVTGRNDNRMAPQTMDVRDLEGKTARLQIVDNESGPWGNIGVDAIVFSDRTQSGKLEDQPDYGSMGLALLDPTPGDRHVAALPAGDTQARVFGSANAPPTAPENADRPADQKLVGGLGRTVALAPGQEAKITFVVTWHFVNDRIDGLRDVGGRHYGTRFKNARAVAAYVAKGFVRLSEQTRLWHATWYDSTLPRWFLDRTFLNTSVLATSTCHRFANGRFYGWEGVGCCPGTCTHVWHYAHAAARLFPQLERSAREIVDYGLAFDAVTGVIDHRGEFRAGPAIDGQAGCILRAYREHQMTPDGAFLRRLWPRVKNSLEYLIRHDPNRDGIMDGPQHNTLDAQWFGKIAWLSSLYVAALRAGEAMAAEMGDTAFAQQARTIAAVGSSNIDGQLFNGEYYIQIPDPDHAKTVGSYDGCEIDQVFGQSWAFQVGLGRILPRPRTVRALQSLWRYNFTPDVGPYRNAHKPGRWYAMAGEGGLLMCTWPKGEGSRVSQHFDFYFNECMTGFEYQAAGHMLWEGMLTEGLAVTRAIHDRYHPSRRNPWNEVECGDHYARAMASYGVYLAACGYEHHGPKGHLAFAPRLTPEDFKAAFTTAEGWGTFAQQKKDGGQLQAEITPKWGRLRLKTLALAVPAEVSGRAVDVTLDGRAVQAAPSVAGGTLTVTLASDVTVKAGQRLQIRVG